jgi:hypothetical protein
MKEIESKIIKVFNPRGPKTSIIFKVMLLSLSSLRIHP